MTRRTIIKARKAQLLCEAWHGPLTLKAIAKKHKVKAGTVSKFWQAARGDGRLPAHPAERPYFATVVAAPAFEDDDPDDAIAFDADSDAPIGGPMGLRIPNPDPLLASLRAHHADIDFAEAHIAPELLREAPAKRQGAPA